MSLRLDILVTTDGDADTASELCRSLPDYRCLEATFPAPEWNRRWVETYRRSDDVWAVGYEIEIRRAN